MPKTVYLTGAPAAGKSSTARLLSERVENLLIWEYGARLTSHVKNRTPEFGDQNELRARSASVVTPEDVAEVDRLLLDFVEANRASRNIIIDSHAVTKERYGFRITPFSPRIFSCLAPDEIWVLSASPETTIARIENNSDGRPMVTTQVAATHTIIQSAVAVSYSLTLGIPCYLFDTDGEREGLLSILQQRLT